MAAGGHPRLEWKSCEAGSLGIRGRCQLRGQQAAGVPEKVKSAAGGPVTGPPACLESIF